MSDYIDRGEVLRKIKDLCCCGAWDKMHLCDAILDIQAADVAPVRHECWDDSGHWYDPVGTPVVRCTGCGTWLMEREYRRGAWQYCPVCGAKMDGRRREL